MNTVEQRYLEFRRTMAEDVSEKPADAPQAETPRLEFKPRGCYQRGMTLAAVVERLKAGHGVRATARLTGVTKVTVGKIRRQLVAQCGEIYCSCGQPATHQGWCTVRFSASLARQQTLANMHRRSFERTISA